MICAVVISLVTNIIYIRNVYKTIYEKLKSQLQNSNSTLTKDKKQFHICGMPMIGKTHFLYYAFAWLPVDFPDLPGNATVGVIPTKLSSSEWFNDVKCRQKEKDEGNYKHAVKVAEVAHNDPTFRSREIRELYKDNIFLIDNAKTEYTVYFHTNTCIVFAGLKLESSALIENVKSDTTMYWMPVWSPVELTDFVHLIPLALPDGVKNDIPHLLHYFGGTIGNMTYKDRNKRIQALKLKCDTAATQSALTTLICQSSTDIIAEFSSLVEIVVSDDHKFAGTKYVSSFVSQHIMLKYLLGKRITFAQFWKDGANESPMAYGNIYERHLPFFMSKGDKLKITVAPFANGKDPTYFNNSKEVTMKFTDYVSHKERTSPYCVQVGHLVQMFCNCPCIDFYTIQKNGANILAQDVTSDVPDDVKFADRNDKTYTVYLIQATVG